MTKKTIYIANDGTEFETKAECEYYENRYMMLIDTPDMVFFNENLEPLTKHITDDYSWCDLFGKSCYINIPSVKCFDLLDEAYYEFFGDQFVSCDFSDSDNKIGLWRYNASKYFWENLIEVKAETDKIIEQANGIVLKEKENYVKKENI